VEPKDIARRGWAWFRDHQQTIRDWLVLFAAVIVGLVGWQQIKDERNARKGAEREQARLERRAQADEISAWSAERRKGEQMNVILSNRSQQPVYQAVVLRKPTGATGKIEPYIKTPEIQTIWVIPPGEYRVSFRHRSNRAATITIAFRDHSGNTWVRHSNGVLRQINRSPPQFFDLEWPISWQLPEKTP
jgi:hypothetical protein